MKTFLLTLDYELWGDGSGDVFELMIEPTAKILNVCDAYNAKMTIFFEVVEYWRLKEEWEKGNRMGYSQNPVEAIENQFREAVKKGHDVQLHIHPQWVDAQWSESGWRVDDDNLILGGYRPKRGLSLRDVFKKGKETIEEILRSVCPEYSCIAFRAGYYNVFPSQNILHALTSLGLRLDSSVYNGGYANGRVTRHDFRNVDDKRGNWFVGNDFCTAAPSKTSLVELPIFAISVPKWKKFLRFSKIVAAFCNLKKTRAKLEKQIDVEKQKNFLSKLSFFIGYDSQNWDICIVSSRFQKQFLAKVNDVHRKYGRENFVVIGHSKCLKSTKTLENLLKIESPTSRFISISRLDEEMELFH